jgi:beta-lactamase class A
LAKLAEERSYEIPQPLHKDSWIPRNLPADVKIANNPGSLEGVRNDSGIVFVEGSPYVICVTTAFPSNERDGEQEISQISFAATAAGSGLRSAAGAAQ